MVMPDKEEVRKKVWFMLRMVESHANVERKTLNELYREEEDGGLRNPAVLSIYESSMKLQCLRRLWCTEWMTLLSLLMRMREN